MCSPHVCIYGYEQILDEYQKEYVEHIPWKKFPFKRDNSENESESPIETRRMFYKRFA